MRKTIADACSGASLDLIGATTGTDEAEELLQWHATLVLYQVEALVGLASYHMAFPWQCVLFLDPTQWSSTFDRMAKIWSFVINVADTLQSDSGLFHELGITRHQSFRDVMIKAEHFICGL